MSPKSLLCGAAICALGAGSALAADITYVPPPPTFTPPPPPPAVQAHVELYGGFLSLSTGGSERDDGFLFGGAGRANVPFSDGWNLQLDAQGSSAVFSYGKESYSYPQYAGYAHLYRRDPSSHALGLFGGASYPQGASLYTIGVEGQMYWPQFTLYGQASVSSVHGSDEGWALQLRGEGQWFVNDDTALLGDVMWTHLDLDGYTPDTLTLAGTLIHRFNGGPFSGFVRGRYDTINIFDDVSVDDWSAVAGVRVSADPPGSTDKSHRRTGPAMDVLTAPTYGFTGPRASDRRLKRDIVLVGRLANGIGLYRYRYLWRDTVYVGVIAQEVARIVPEAVVQGADGFLRVDYARLGLRLMTWDEWLASGAGALAAAA